MEKENKIIFITESLKKEKKIRDYDFCYNPKRKNKKAANKIKTKKNKQILIYDKTFSEKHKEGTFFHVNDHVNKTGKNPLIINKDSLFLDVSCVYNRSKKGIITTSLGKKYKKEKTKNKYPSTDLCLITIWCKSINPKIKINAKLLNIL